MSEKCIDFNPNRADYMKISPLFHSRQYRKLHRKVHDTTTQTKNGLQLLQFLFQRVQSRQLIYSCTETVWHDILWKNAYHYWIIISVLYLHILCVLVVLVLNADFIFTETELLFSFTLSQLITCIMVLCFMSFCIWNSRTEMDNKCLSHHCS